MKEKKIHCPEVLDSESWSQHPLASGVVLVATLLPGRWEQGGNKGKNKSHVCHGARLALCIPTSLSGTNASGGQCPASPIVTHSLPFGPHFLRATPPSHRSTEYQVSNTKISH